jgi:hypothetical protein
MVVGHDHPNTRCPGRGNRFECRDPTIAGNDQGSPGSPGRLEPGRTEVVPVTKPVGHERHHIGPGKSQRAGEECGGTLAIHIIVTVDHDAVAGLHSGRNSLYCIRHSGERMRIGEVGECRPQILAGRLFRTVTPLNKQRSEG